MAPWLTLIVVLCALALIVTRVRQGHVHLRVSDWPLGKQLESGLALLFAGAAILGAIAGEYAFAGWLGLMAGVVAAFSVLTWPKDRR